MNKPPFDALNFSQDFITTLPGDPVDHNHVRQVEGCAYSRVLPTPVSHPQLLSFIPELLELLGLPKEAPLHPQFLEVLAGNTLSQGMAPFATCYGGHQFGHWAGQLGDGRAINLGEVLSPQNGKQILQLKGAGRTPYSRSADGRAVLRSSVREYVCSEAIHHLGIPTTRALSLILTGDSIMRDMFYDGRARLEPGAIVCRVAPSFTRFGHFELPAARGEFDLLKRWVDYSLHTEFAGVFTPDSTGYAGWFSEIATRTARLMVDWQRVGFVHGVMNTDNLSILGLTIDYGPYGWLEGFDPNWTPNTTDAAGKRYAYGQQPRIARWNLIRLANAIYPLINDPIPLQDAIERYDQVFSEGWKSAMLEKLGLRDKIDAANSALIDSLWSLLSLRETDFTLFFRGLSSWDTQPILEDSNQVPSFLRTAWYDASEPSKSQQEAIIDWFQSYRHQVNGEGLPPLARQTGMLAVNPKFIFRNYLAQQVIDEIEAGSTTRLETLMETLKRPYDEQPDRLDFAQKRPEWARHKAGCSMLSCSS